MRPLEHFLDPQRWRRLVTRPIEIHRRRRGDDRLDAKLAELGPVTVPAGEAVVIGDALWYNPGHFFRLRLFVEALVASGERFRLVGLLRRRDDWRARRALERIGFSEFAQIEDDPAMPVAKFLDTAADMLRGAASHGDLLGLRLPHDLPTYVWYDTMLKAAAHPQPPIGDPRWCRTLAETLRNLALYDRLLQQRQVDKVVLSHPWKSEWGSLVWLAISQETPVYHLASFNEGLRMRRFRSRADYKDPVEHLPWEKFAILPDGIRARLAGLGYRALTARSAGSGSDVNVRHAYRPEHRIADRIQARQALSGQSNRPVVLVMGHAWYDFPHAFGMSNFTDFLDWSQVTLEAARRSRDAVWLIKPHPTERWYGGFSMSEVARDLPDHVKLLPLATDATTALLCADAVVTVHGTGALEAVAAGVPVIAGDRSYYTRWNIAHVARDRADYVELLSRAHDLPRPDQITRDHAAACFALALAEPPEVADAMRMSCDSLQWKLNDQICDLLFRQPETMAAERDQLMQFLGQDEIDSFGTFKLLRSLQ